MVNFSVDAKVRVFLTQTKVRFSAEARIRVFLTEEG
jgi:hypothetical protein